MRSATEREIEWLGIVKAEPCYECRDTGVTQTSVTECHHVREGSSYKRHDRIVPICSDHHLELHSSRKAWRDRENRWLKELKEDQ